MGNKLTITPKQFGLEKKQASTIEEAFKPKIKEREILANQYGEIIKKDITTETCQEATLLRRQLVKVRTGIADIHKKQKSFYLAAGKFVDAWKNKETLPVTQMEEGLSNIETHFEKIEEEKREVIRQKRSDELEKYETVYDAGDLADLGDTIYNHFLNGVRADFKAKKETERKVEEERIAKEKAEIEEQKRIKAENEKLKKEAELKRIADEKAEAERQRLAKIEHDKAEAERKQREAKAEKERLAHEAELKRVNDERAKIQKEFEARQEEARKAELKEIDRLKSEADAKRKAELAPDKEKLTKWVNEMKIGIETKNLTQESEYIVIDIYNKFDSFKAWAKGEIEKIK